MAKTTKKKSVRVEPEGQAHIKATFNNIIISITNNAPDSFPLGETTVTWTATDSSGNFATATQTVSVVDTTSPTLTVPENIIVDSFTLEKLVVIGEAYAFDSVDAF